MLHTPIAQITALIAAGVVAWAVRAGGWPERLAALCIALDWLGGVIFQDHRPHHHGQPAMFVCDLIQAAVFLVLVCRCRRVWVLWGAALAALLALTHVVFMLSPSFGQWSYLTVTYVWSLGLLASLAVGVGLEGRRPVQTLSWSA